MSGDAFDDEASRPKRRKKKVSSSHYKANNEGGYGNPPVKNQFTGATAGPGRPKKKDGLEARMRRMLNGKVPTKDGGSVTTHEAFAMSARKAMLSNGVRGIKLGLQLNKMFAPPAQQEDCYDVRDAKFCDLEMEILLALLDRVQGGPPSRGPRPSPLGLPSDLPVGLCRAFRRDDGHLVIEKIEPD